MPQWVIDLIIKVVLQLIESIFKKTPEPKVVAAKLRAKVDECEGIACPPRTKK